MEPLNLSAKALPYLREGAKRLHMNGWRMAAALSDALITAVDTAQKFILPDGGRIFDETMGISETMLTSFHLPYDTVVFEFHTPHSGETATEAAPIPVKQRLIVAMECHKFLELFNGADDYLKQVFADKSFDFNGCIVWPIDCMAGAWIPCWVGLYIPYDQTPRPVTPEERAIQEETSKEMATRLNRTDMSLREFPVAVKYIPFGELGLAAIDEFGKDKARLATALFTDTGLELEVVIQTCAALECINVQTEEVHPPKALQKARQRRGVNPLYSYHVLMVKPSNILKGDAQGGHHSSPRTHLRRGHIRHLPGEPVRKVWVRACVVAAESIHGSVKKDYCVTPRGEKSV